MTPAISREQNDIYSPEDIHSRVEQTRAEIANLEGKHKKLDAKLAGLSEQRHQYDLLDQVYASLEKLDQMGAAHLFWGEKNSPRISPIRSSMCAPPPRHSYRKLATLSRKGWR